MQHLLTFFGYLVVTLSQVECITLDRSLVQRSDTDTNPAPISGCVTDTCKIIGDPHVTRFDKKWVSLLDVSENAHSNVQEGQAPAINYGVYEVVKNEEINIQAAFGKNGHVLLKLMVSGNLFDGKVLTIRPNNEAITWGDDSILSTFPSSFDNEYFSAKFSNQTDEVQRAKNPKKTRGVDITINRGNISNGMTITVIRKAKHLNIAVTMCAEDADWGTISDLPRSTGMCTPKDSGTTVAPEADLDIQSDVSDVCVSGTCNIFGDPHITRFDGQWVSLLQGGSQAAVRQKTQAIQKPGDFWLVKSPLLSIQARFGRNGPMMTHVAVGGELLKDNVLIIGAKKDAVHWNGEKILTDFPSMFTSVDGIATVRYENQTSMVHRPSAGKSGKKPPSQVVGVTAYLPKDVRLMINRLDRSINAAITLCTSVTGTFSGYCGSIDSGKDPMLTELNSDSVYEVPASESLFSTLPRTQTTKHLL